MYIEIRVQRIATQELVTILSACPMYYNVRINRFKNNKIIMMLIIHDHGNSSRHYTWCHDIIINVCWKFNKANKVLLSGFVSTLQMIDCMVTR